MDRHSPWRARSQILQYLENTGVFRHVVGHGTACTNQAMLPHKDGSILVFDHHSVGGGSSWINGSASPIEPGIVFVVFDQAHLTIWAVATCPGLMLGYVRLLQLFKARSRGNERQLLILA